MPKVWQKYGKSDSLIGLWEIKEEEAELTELSGLQVPEELKHPDRRLHWGASRALLRQMLEEIAIAETELVKNEFGSPALKNEACQLSISHAGNYAAVALSPERRIGVDVEQVTPRISRIRNKFMNELELSRLENEKDLRGMYLIWSAKEALFKYHPEPEFDFRSELRIDAVEIDHLKARIIRNGREEALHVPYHWQEDYVLAWTEKP